VGFWFPLSLTTLVSLVIGGSLLCWLALFLFLVTSTDGGVLPVKKPEEQLTFADLDLPKTRGRPRKPDSEKLTRAEINRRYRDKKKREGVQLIQVSKAEAEVAKQAVEDAGLDALAARIAGKFE